MKISRSEQIAIIEVLAYGEAHGYGNLISHLQTAWAKHLVGMYGMDEAAARRASGGNGYPFKMQEDVIERGEWDETGARYSVARPREKRSAPSKRKRRTR